MIQRMLKYESIARRKFCFRSAKDMHFSLNSSFFFSTQWVLGGRYISQWVDIPVYLLVGRHTSLQATYGLARLSQEPIAHQRQDPSRRNRETPKKVISVLTLNISTTEVKILTTSTRAPSHSSRPRSLFSKTLDLISTDHDLRNIYQDPSLQEIFLFLCAVLKLFCKSRYPKTLVRGSYLSLRHTWYLCSAWSRTSTQEFFIAFCDPWSLSHSHPWSSPHKPHCKNSSLLLPALIFLNLYFSEA